jgi:PEP-CTERM motif-containing protein
LKHYSSVIEPHSTQHPTTHLMHKVLLVPCLLFVFAVGRLFAVDYNETSTTYNSHNLPASAEGVPFDAMNFTSLDHILGSLSINPNTLLSEGADVYKIFISNPSAFSASTTSLAGGRNGFDTQLFLFNSNGTGVATNDDKSPGAQSLLPSGNALYSSLAAGFYYLVITGAGSHPADMSNVRIFPNQDEGSDPTGIYGPKNGTPDETNAVWTQFSGNSTEGGTYSIALTGASIAVPEPGTLALIVTGSIAGLLLFRRKKLSR